MQNTKLTTLFVSYLDKNVYSAHMWAFDFLKLLGFNACRHVELDNLNDLQTILLYPCRPELSFF